jgi:fatty acid desaturase (delta-4 desaturase)
LFLLLCCLTPTHHAPKTTHRYKFETPFERDIKKEVFKIVRRGREFGTPGFYLRALFYVSLFFALQHLWVTKGSSFTLAVAYGISQAFIGLSVQHDANHGAVSKRRWINELLGFGIDFIGGNKWIWLEQHWTHHAYTNHCDKDPDGAGAEPMLLFKDYPLGHPARTWLHHFQALFFVPVLSGYWLSSVFNLQVLDLKQRGAQSAGLRMDNDFIVSRRKYAIILRVLYIVTNVLSPFWHHGIGWLPLAHVMAMGIAGSLTLAIPFTLSHNFEHCDRDPTADVRKTGDPVCWFKSQVETSCTYGGFVSGCLTGGLNFQVEHHLFPRMNSAWYPYIAPAVREVCKKHGVKYVYYPWIWQNLISTMKYTHKVGTGWNWVTDPLSGKA